MKKIDSVCVLTLGTSAQTVRVSGLACMVQNNSESASVYMKERRADGEDVTADNGWRLAPGERTPGTVHGARPLARRFRRRDGRGAVLLLDELLREGRRAMTLGEAKNKVYMLLDEHSAGGEVEHDEDIEKKMTAFFDTAQKTLAQIRRIVREYALPLAMGKTAYEMPSDFSALYRVWADGRITRALRWRAGKLLVPEGYAAEIVVEYFAVPNTIPQDAPDSCEFEIDAEACECMPYYVAAQQLLPDLVLDYGAMLQMYDRRGGALAARASGREPARRAEPFPEVRPWGRNAARGSPAHGTPPFAARTFRPTRRLWRAAAARFARTSWRTAAPCRRSGSAGGSSGRRTSRYTACSPEGLTARRRSSRTSARRSTPGTTRQRRWRYSQGCRRGAHAPRIWPGSSG